MVIGNGSYSSFGSLKNSVNDANDVAETLQSLGFTVDIIRNGNLIQMENAAIKFKNRLSDVSQGNAYGFFFYAGHGVQLDGINYLIPVDANIPDRNFLRERTLSMQIVMDMLNDAGNKLNIVVLDACRDIPAAWSRSANRGLAVISPPMGSIIMYSTGAGRTASDGTGRNGLFTTHLLESLKTPGLDVNEVFRRTGAAVAEASHNEQRPALYTDFHETAYLGSKPLAPQPVQPDPVQPVEAAIQPAPQPASAPDPWPGKEPTPVKPARPSNPEKPGSSKTTVKDKSIYRLNSIGASVGSTFSAPFFVGSVFGTYAPTLNSFIEVGADFGFISGYSDVGYFSVYPYAHYAFFLPINRKNGLYAGAGGGYMIAKYSFPDGDISNNTIAADICTGFIFANLVNISYTLRTNFSSANNRLALGVIYRFK